VSRSQFEDVRPLDTAQSLVNTGTGGGRETRSSCDPTLVERDVRFEEGRVRGTSLNYPKSTKRGKRSSGGLDKTTEV